MFFLDVRSQPWPVTKRQPLAEIFLALDRPRHAHTRTRAGIVSGGFPHGNSLPCRPRVANFAVFTEFVYSSARHILCAAPTSGALLEGSAVPASCAVETRCHSSEYARASTHHVQTDFRVQHRALPVQFILPLWLHSVSATAPMSRDRQGNRTVPLQGNCPEITTSDPVLSGPNGSQKVCRVSQHLSMTRV